MVRLTTLLALALAVTVIAGDAAAQSRVTPRAAPPMPAGDLMKLSLAAGLLNVCART